MIKKLFLLFMLVAWPAYGQDLGYYTVPDCTLLTPLAFNTVCLQGTTANGLTQGVLYKYDSTGWTNVSASVSGAGHAIKDEGGSALTTRANLNFTGNLVTATDNAGTNATDITIGTTWSAPTNHGVVIGTGSATTFSSTTAGSAGECLTSNGASADPTFQSCSVNQAGNFAWTGTHSFVDGNLSIKGSADATKITKIEVDGQTAGQTRTWTGPDASTRLIGDSDFSATGVMSRTASGTYAGRTISGTTGNVTVTNGGGVAGNPTIDLGTTAVQTDQGNTYTTGDQDFGSASSFKFPTSNGAAPTVDGRCAYDNAAGTRRYKCGVNGSTITLAPLAEVQPLSSNLTAFSNLAGTNNATPIFTAAATLTTATLPSCADSGGQHLNYDNSAHTFSCGTSSTGGLSGLTTNKYLMATGATTADTSGNLSQSAGVVNASGGFTIGTVSTDYISFDTSAVTGANTWTIQDTAGTIIPCDAAGTFTNGHVIIATVAGGVVTCSDGGAAGTGTWTDASSSTGTNKTIDVEASGNVITTVSKMWLPTVGGTAASPGLLWDTMATLAPTPLCVEGGTVTTLLSCHASFPDSDGEYAIQQPILLPSDWSGAVDLKFMWKAAATSGDVVWQAATLCRADAEVDDGGSFNAASTVTDTAKGTTLQLNTASISGLTMTNCAAGELLHLKVFRQRTHASDTISGTVLLVGVEVTMRRAQ